MQMLRRIIGVSLRDRNDEIRKDLDLKCVTLPQRQGRIGSDGLDTCTERMMYNRQKTSCL